MEISVVKKDDNGLGEKYVGMRSRTNDKTAMEYQAAAYFNVYKRTFELSNEVT